MSNLPDAMSDIAIRARAKARSRQAPLFLQAQGSVWPATKTPILLFTLYGAVIYLLSLAGLAPNLGKGASSLTSVLSMITGLMISYRSSSSSERWHNGRAIFASLTSSVRVLTTTLYLSLLPPKFALDDPSQRAAAKQQEAAVRDLLNLIIAYCYALKNHLRDSDSLEDRKFCEMLPQALLYAFRSTPQAQRTLPSRGSSDDIGADEKFGRVLNDTVGATTSATPTQTRATRLGAPQNMPLFLLRQIQNTMNDFHVTLAPARGSPGSETVLLETPTWATCLGVIKEMTDQLSQAERIRDTPIPKALGIHVQQMLVLYCLSIPPQLVDLLGLWVIPVSAVVAWTFWGVDSAASQLSDPFGTDANDLPTDKFIATIHSEFLELVGEGTASGSSANDELLGLPDSLGERAKGE